MRDPKKYCVYTYNYPFIDNDGYVALCCKNIKHKLPYHISEYSLEYIWNSPEMLEVRRQFEAGEEPGGCFKCYEPERNGVRSFREKTLGMINKRVPFEDNTIRALDLRLGNICNLRCTMCFAGNSNRIYQRLPEMAEHFGWSEKKLNSELEKYQAKYFDWADNDQAWENIMSVVTPDLQHVYLAGGEPFYLKNFISTVERIGNVATGAKFVINSNGTRLLRDKDLEKFAGKNINIRLSVDGWGKADEFTRQETVWEEKLKIMDQYYEHFNIDAWDITANAFSVRQIPQLMDYISERYPGTQIQVRPVINKQEVALSNIPENLRQGLVEYFTDYMNSHEYTGLDHVIQQLEIPYTDNPELKQKMRTFVEYYNNTGVVKLDEFDKELSDWLFA